MSEEDGKEEEKKELQPEGAMVRNFLNVISDLVSAEVHYCELAARSKEKGNEDDARFYEEMQDDTRYLRQKWVSLIPMSGEAWCSLKHLLSIKENIIETYQKAYRKNMETEEMLGIERGLEKLVTTQFEQMIEYDIENESEQVD